MKNIYKYMLYVLIIFSLCITNVYASCTDSELSKFNKVKKDYTVTYEIDKTTEKYNVYFKVPMPQNFYYQIYSAEELKCNAIDDKTIKCTELPADFYEVMVVGVTDECDDVLKTIELELPKYNSLSSNALCDGIEEFILCRPDYSEQIDYEEFVALVNTYGKEHNEIKEEDNNPKEEPMEETKDDKTNVFISKILNYVQNYLLEIIIVVIFVVLVTITVIITAKSIRKSRRLEW